MCARTTPRRRKKEIDESSDTYDTVEWLIKNVKGHNNKVGITGISYPGFYTVCGMIDAHPAVKGGITASSGYRLVHRRRLAPQRLPVPPALLQLYVRLR